MRAAQITDTVHHARCTIIETFINYTQPDLQYPVPYILYIQVALT